MRASLPLRRIFSKRFSAWRIRNQREINAAHSCHWSNSCRLPPLLRGRIFSYSFAFKVWHKAHYTVGRTFKSDLRPILNRCGTIKIRPRLLLQGLKNRSPQRTNQRIDLWQKQWGWHKICHFSDGQDKSSILHTMYFTEIGSVAFQKYNSFCWNKITRKNLEAKFGLGWYNITKLKFNVLYR